MATFSQQIQSVLRGLLGKQTKEQHFDFITSFTYETNKNELFIVNKVGLIPFDFRIIVRNRYNKLVEQHHGNYDHAQRYIEKLASFCSSMPINITISYKSLYCRVETLADICTRLMKQARKQNKSYDQIIQIFDDIASKFNLSKIKSINKIGKLNRYSNVKWWMNKLKFIYLQSKDTVARYLRLICKERQVYLLNQNFEILKENRARNKIFIESLVAINEAGEKFNLDDIRDGSLSNTNNRSAELNARFSGFEQYAKKHGYEADLITITAPSRFHAVHMSGFPNKKYNKSSVSSAQEYFTSNWDCIRAKIHRNHYEHLGFRVVEPHHDGTPHWHFLVFSKKEHREKVINTFKDYFLKDSPREFGAESNRVNILPINIHKKGSNYLKKTLKKELNLTGKNESKKNISSDDLERIYEWGCLWKIRQFEQFGGPPVGVWREARRIAKEAKVPDNPLWKAAKEGDWLSYIELSDCMKLSRLKAPIKLYKQYDETLNMYGEEKGLKVKGLIIDDQVYISRKHKWEIINLAELKRREITLENYQ
jgi:hypothetical protein